MLSTVGCGIAEERRIAKTFNRLDCSVGRSRVVWGSFRCTQVLRQTVLPETYDVALKKLKMLSSTQSVRRMGEGSLFVESRASSLIRHTAGSFGARVPYIRLHPIRLISNRACQLEQ